MRLICVLALASLSIPAIGDEQKLFDLLSKRLEAAEQAERWSDAIALTHQIIRRCPTEDYLREGRLADIGKFQLKLLDFEASSESPPPAASTRTRWTG